jgi:hypothetical protein
MILAVLIGLFAGPDAPATDRQATLYPVLEEAYRHFEARAYPQAIKAFERAFAISPEPRFVLNIAVTRRKAEECALSLAAFERFFELCDGCAQQEAAEPLAREARTWCQPTVRIEAMPANAHITIDGVALGAAPLEHALVVGAHVIRATANGHLPTERPLLVKGGDAARVTLTLRPVEVPAPPPPDRRWLWGSAAVGGAGLVTGGVFGLLLMSDLDDERQADTREALDSARSAAKRDAVIAQVGLGLAVAGIGTALTLWALEDEVGSAAIRMGPGGISGRF